MALSVLALMLCAQILVLQDGFVGYTWMHEGFYIGYNVRTRRFSYFNEYGERWMTC